MSGFRVASHIYIYMYTILHSITVLTTLKMYTSDYHTVGTAQDSSLSEQETVPENRTGTHTLIEY